MKIRSKNGETMFWVGKYGKMISFVDGVANVDEKVGKEMVACGYKQEGVATVTKPKTVVEPQKETVAQPSVTQPKFKV
jgi:hypothetical protein